MDSPPAEKIIKLASLWFHSIPGISLSLRLYWNQTLAILFEDQLSKEKILFFALRKEKEFREEDNLVLSASLALLHLVKNEAESTHDLSGVRNIVKTIEDVKGINGVNDKITQEYIETFQNQLDKHASRMELKVPTTIIPLLADHILRWIVLWTFIPELGTLFWWLNIVLIPGPIILFSWWSSRRIESYHRKILQPYGGISSVTLIPQRNAFQLTLMVFLMIVGVAVSLTISDFGDESIPIAVFTGIGYLIYFGIYLKHFSIKGIKEKDLIQQFNIPRYEENLSPDENDEAIVDQISKMKSITGRLEAYVLESALFGALSFSAFLQIMAEELVSFRDLENFANHSFALFNNFVQNWEGLSISVATLTSKSDLFALVSVETLICSILFLVVIASRLRFSDIADKVTHSLDLAQSYNEKEENLLIKGNLNKEEAIRLKEFNQKIYQQLIETKIGLAEMEPITAFMRFFRNAGILTFLIILVSSALFISSFLSWLFALLGITSLLYFNRKYLMIVIQKLVYGIRWSFIRTGNLFLVTAVLTFLSGFFLRTLAGWSNTDVLLMTGFLLLGTYFFTWIVLIPHYDKSFEKYKDQELEKTTGWMTIRIFWGIGVFVMVQGFSMRFLDIVGSAAMIGLGCSSMAVIFILIGPRLSQPKWVGAVAGIAISILTMGNMFKLLHLPGGSAMITSSFSLIPIILSLQGFLFASPRWTGIPFGFAVISLMFGITFKILHLTGANILLTLGVIFSIITFIILRIHPFRKKFFHRIFFTNGIVMILIGLTLTVDPKYTGELAYDNYTLNGEMLARINSIHFEGLDLRHQIASGKHPRELSKQMSGYLNEVDWYIKYSQEIPYNHEHRRFATYSFDICLYILRNYEDQTALEWGYRLSRQANLLGEKVGYSYRYDSYRNLSRKGDNEPLWLPVLEPLFLQKLGRYEETKIAVNRILRYEQLEPGEMEAEMEKFIPNYIN